MSRAPQQRASTEDAGLLRYDLLLNLLDRTVGLRPPSIIVFVLVMFSGGTMLLCAFEGTLLPGSIKDGFFTQRWIHNWTIIPIIFPIFFVVLVGGYRQMGTMINTLCDDDVLRGDSATLLAELHAAVRPRRVDELLIIGTVVMFLTWFYIASFRTGPSWMTLTPGVPSLAAIYREVAACVAVYVVARFAWANTVVFHKLHRIFGGEEPYEFALKQLHPDRCAGLRPISSFVFRTSLLIFLLGILGAGMIVTTLINQERDVVASILRSPISIIVISSYVVVAPLFFFGPLLSAHGTMHREKRAMLLELSGAYDGALIRIRKDLHEGTDVTDRLDRLDQLRRLYDQASSMPVWPFDGAIFAKFGAAALLPVVLPFLVEVGIRLAT